MTGRESLGAAREVTPMDTWRNRLAVRLCNVILHTVATRTYRDTLGEIILVGMKRNV